MADENQFIVTINRFYQGLSPMWLQNSLAAFGNSGHANDMRAVNVLDPTYITQGPGLTDLTNGNNLGEPINFLMDKWLSTGQLYAIGNTKLYEFLASVTNDGDFPHTITNCVEGKSCITMGGYLYYFYNKASGGDIGRHALGTSTFDDDWGSTVPATGAAAIESARHPVAVKETLMAFGNGRYLGFYDAEIDKLEVQKLDFGEGAEVSDVMFYNDYWWFSVNQSDYKNGERTQIYIYDAAGLSSVLSDEISLSLRTIGFLKNINGIIYVSYWDSGGIKIGYLSGRQLRQIGQVSNDLPRYNQKTEYRGVLLVTDGVDIYAVGSIDPSLPQQISMIADGDGLTSITALGGLTGNNVARGTDSYRLSRFSGYSTYSTWTSLIFNMMKGDKLAFIDKVVVLTKPLGMNAKCNLYIKKNQDSVTSAAKTITTKDKTRHVFKFAVPDVEDFRVYLDWAGAGASSSNDCAIREIQVIGHWKESI